MAQQWHVCRALPVWDGLWCARAGWARPTSHTNSKRFYVIYNTCLRFAARPRGPGWAHKSHTKSSRSCYVRYFVWVCGAPALAGPGPQVTQQVNDQFVFTILVFGLRCARAYRAWPRSHTTNPRLASTYYMFFQFAVHPRGPGRSDPHPPTVQAPERTNRVSIGYRLGID